MFENLTTFSGMSLVCVALLTFRLMIFCRTKSSVKGWDQIFSSDFLYLMTVLMLLPFWNFVTGFSALSEVVSFWIWSTVEAIPRYMSVLTKVLSVFESISIHFVSHCHFP